MENVVLVGVDGSPESLRAADWALAEASGRRWQIAFANIFPPSATADPQVEAAYLLAARRAAELIFEELQAAARALHVRFHGHVLSGRASDVLVQLSAGAGLSVVGRRNRTGFTSRMGSVSSALAAHSHCPTAIIPHGWQPPRIRC
jgi:nucleotide-binding universal stress UspA family protein